MATGEVCRHHGMDTATFHARLKTGRVQETLTFSFVHAKVVRSDQWHDCDYNQPHPRLRNMTLEEIAITSNGEPGWR